MENRFSMPDREREAYDICSGYLTRYIALADAEAHYRACKKPEHLNRSRAEAHEGFIASKLVYYAAFDDEFRLCDDDEAFLVEEFGELAVEAIRALVFDQESAYDAIACLIGR